ncbi:hypothetical protein DENIS_0940 [Desulfonema ishimotonii]|uniref:Uncharacterized protein n=2 Tax=Desulfonema ishimotonii TaxID=45657 RepID=A0A401FSR0_9BACT|nr:hypothetical protein DENIS_0940 [Desulfonema ishimotonii]
MAEIRSVLCSRNMAFHDRRLSWGAKLSAYADEMGRLPDGATPVFIELIPDIPFPDGAVVIDHHGERAGRDEPTALGQVADLLDIRLNRRQQLISANDRGHIRGMEAMGATPDEIMEIRALDRKAQGVTEEDERLAQETVEKCLEIVGPSGVIIHSLTNRTSAVTDRIYGQFRHIFIYTPDGQMHYFGTGHMVGQLRKCYEKFQGTNPSAEFWFGVDLPDYGFFGTDTPLDKEEIQEMTQRKSCSHHLFMFPFTVTPKDRAADFMETVPSALGSGWLAKAFDPTAGNPGYSEYFYFHHFVRDALYSGADGDDDFPLMKYLYL